MFPRLIAIIGILMALFGVMIAPGFNSRRLRTQPLALHKFDPDECDLPWDLTNWIPVGILDVRKGTPEKEWTWMPEFRRVK
ncbi:MAG: hypothetical protein NTY09_01990 [bacterium]|nr:hypothetical protein [bacterium]